MSSNFTFHTTAAQVADAFAREISGKNVLVTGTSLGGLGFETARVLAKYANLVIITGYNAERLALTEGAIKKDFPNANVRKLMLDLSSLAAVRAAAEEVNAYPEPLHVLINNAAAAIGPFKVTPDNLEFQVATGFIGPFLFTNLLMPKLLAARTETYTPRVVCVSSIAHGMGPGVDPATFGAPNPEKYPTIFGPYYETKSAIILFASELSRRAEGKVHAFSLNPGLIYTNLIHDAAAGFQSEGVLDESGKPNEENFKWKTIPEGTSTTIAAAFDPSLTDKAGAYLDDSVVANEKIAEHSRNAETAKQVWEATEKIVGQSFAF